MNTYGVVPTSLIEDPAWIALSVNAKVVYVTCESFRWNTPAGIFVYHAAVLAQSAGLTLDETEAALAELEKTPTPATSFIVRDDRILWLRRHLGQRPGLSLDNDNHKIAVRNIIAALPPGSVVVRKYRKYHKSWWPSHPSGMRRPSEGPAEPPTGSIAGSGSKKLKAITPAVSDCGAEGNSPTREPRSQPPPRSPEGLASAGSGNGGEPNNVNGPSEGNTSTGVGNESEQWRQACATMAERRMAHTPGLAKETAERVADRHLEEHRWKSPSAPVADVIAAALADYARKFPNDGKRPA